MNITKFKSVMAITLLSAAAHSAQADICEWKTSTFETTPSGVAVGFSCRDGENNALAIKQVTVPAVGAPSCAIAVAEGLSNNGTCVSPKISDTVNPFPLRVVNDRTNSACAVRSVAGGPNFSVWGVSCPGFAEAFVEKTFNNGFCSVRASGAGYRVSGSCADFTISQN